LLLLLYFIIGYRKERAGVGFAYKEEGEGQGEGRAAIMEVMKQAQTVSKNEMGACFD